MIHAELVTTNFVYCILTKQKVQGAWRLVFLITAADYILSMVPVPYSSPLTKSPHGHSFLNKNSLPNDILNRCL